MIKRTMMLAAFGLACAGPLAAYDLNWQRLESLMAGDGWQLVAKGKSQRQFDCTTCEQPVTVTIEAIQRTKGQKSRQTVQKALIAHRTRDCKRLERRKEGVCVKPNLAQMAEGKTRYQNVLLYSGDIILGYTRGQNGTPDFIKARGPWIKKMMESVTPLY
jgi:hypothetical protein